MLLEFLCSIKDVMPHDVFISYEKTDHVIATAICARLEGVGVKCWIAPRDVAGNYAAAIVKAIKSSKVMVVVLSPQANTSDFVAKEVERAASNRIPILTVRTVDIP